MILDPFEQALDFRDNYEAKVARAAYYIRDKMLILWKMSSGK